MMNSKFSYGYLLFMDNYYNNFDFAKEFLEKKCTPGTTTNF